MCCDTETRFLVTHLSGMYMYVECNNILEEDLQLSLLLSCRPSCRNHPSYHILKCMSQEQL